MITERPKVISIFSGAGGIDLGFHEAGFDVVYSVDDCEPACRTLKLNGISGLVDCRDIREIQFAEVMARLSLNSIDCVVGGPPCPPYSKSRFYLTAKKRALEDESSFTLNEYFRAIQELSPTVFFFENVHGFIYKPHRAALSYLQKRSRELGYNVSYEIINAADHGVPQTRERFICVGVRKEHPPFVFPRETHYDPARYNPVRDKGKKPWITCRRAIGDLDYELSEDRHMRAGSKHWDLLEQIPPGDNYLFFTRERGHPNPVFVWRSRYWSFLLKLSPDRPSWTIQASHSNNMGPFHWNNRYLRIPEIKRLQTFPDDYEIAGDYRTQWKQVGNAVPPELARVMGDSIREQLFESNEPPMAISYQPELTSLL